VSINYTSKIKNAIDFAIEVHKDQYRKGKDVSYITHPMAVALIISLVSKDEDLICAGLLHDTIEDADPYGSITKEQIEEKFGSKVSNIVNDLTEQDKTIDWAERKRQALVHVNEMSNDSLLVKSADVLHNITDQIADYKIEGDKMFERFNAGKAVQLERYEKLISAIDNKWKENPLIEELIEKLDEVKKLWG